MVALAWESTRNEGRPMIEIKVWLRIYTETGWVFLRSALLRVRSLLYRLTQCKHVLTHRIEYLGDGEVIGQVREFLVILFIFLSLGWRWEKFFFLKLGLNQGWITKSNGVIIVSLDIKYIFYIFYTLNCRLRRKNSLIIDN